jgi:hypothetical protein
MIRIMSRDAAMKLLELAGAVHAGNQTLPPEIEEKKAEVRRARKNAVLFLARTGAIDHGMINLAVRLMHELDRLYAEWAESETP